MYLKELKERIDAMYYEYGDIDVVIDLKDNETVTELDNGYISIEEIRDVTEIKDYHRDNVIGICLSNYEMEDNNWGKVD